MIVYVLRDAARPRYTYKETEKRIKNFLKYKGAMGNYFNITLFSNPSTMAEQFQSFLELVIKNRIVICKITFSVMTYSVNKLRVLKISQMIFTNQV